MIVGRERFENVEVIDRCLDQTVSTSTTIIPVNGILRDMKKKVRDVSDTGSLTVITYASPGFTHGSLRKWQDLHAVPHIVRPFPIMRSPRKHRNQHGLLSQLKQSRVSHHEIRRNDRRRAESCSLPR